MKHILIHSLCYFSLDDLKSTTSFTKVINQSLGSGGYQAQLFDSEMSKYVMKLTNEFFRTAQREGIPQERLSKIAACCMGQQPLSKVWVMNGSIHLDDNGEPIDPDDSPYIWLGAYYAGNGKTIAYASDEANIVDPSRKQEALDTLLCVLKDTIKENFLPAFLFMGGACMVSHFHAIFETTSMCPTPTAVGPKHTGKTTAANSALAMMGLPSHFHISEMTQIEANEQMERNTFPSVFDDPDDMRRLVDIILVAFACAKELFLYPFRLLPNPCTCKSIV